MLKYLQLVFTCSLHKKHVFITAHTLSTHTHTHTDVGECKVLYEYDATQEDELTIRPDDIIKIIEKFDTEWWQGEVNGQVGVFPSSYVEEL